MGGSDAYVRGCTGGSCKRAPSCLRMADVAFETCVFQVVVPIEVDEKRRLERRGEVGIVTDRGGTSTNHQLIMRWCGNVSGVGNIPSPSFFKNMHLARTGVLLRPKPRTGPVSSQLRFASSGNHTHGEHPDSAHSSPEGLPVRFSFQNWD